MSIAKWMAGAALAAGLAVGPALAQEQEGLVNVAIGVEDNVVQVPIGIAANVCPDVDAALLVEEYKGTDKIVCTIDQTTAAQHNIGGQHGGGKGKGQSKQAD